MLQFKLPKTDLSGSLSCFLCASYCPTLWQIHRHLKCVPWVSALRLHWEAMLIHMLRWSQFLTKFSPPLPKELANGTTNGTRAVLTLPGLPGHQLADSNSCAISTQAVPAAGQGAQPPSHPPHCSPGMMPFPAAQPPPCRSSCHSRCWLKCAHWCGLLHTHQAWGTGREWERLGGICESVYRAISPQGNHNGTVIGVPLGCLSFNHHFPPDVCDPVPSEFSPRALSSLFKKWFM